MATYNCDKITLERDDQTARSNLSAPNDCTEDSDVHEKPRRSHHAAAAGKGERHRKHEKSQFDLADWRKELQRFEEFGLGRGVDATDPSPFANKTAFHAIPIDSKDCDLILCTDEGGAFHSIFQSLETSDKNTIQLSADVTLPQTPIQIGAAVEYSRSTMRRGYTIGKKVITRSVEFKTGPQTKDEVRCGEKTEKSKKINYFETWITKQCPKCKVSELVKLILKWRFTHYISKIQLGAAEYYTMSEVYYNSLAKGNSGLGMDKIAELALSASKKHTSSSHVSEMKRIGFMSDEGVVERGNYQEGVLDVQLTSIATLITEDKTLRDNLTKALLFYIATRSFGHIGYEHTPELLASWLRDSTDHETDCGKTIAPTITDIPKVEDETDSVKIAISEIRKMERPPTQHDDTHRYAILCGEGADTLFLDINEKNQVIAKKLDDVDRVLNYFNLRCTETAGEFVLMDYKEFDKKERIIESNPVQLQYDLWPTPRYLMVNTHLGFNFGPLYMEDSVNESQCLLRIRPRLFRDSHGNMSDFTNGKDKFYICTSRRLGRTGYLYVKDRPKVNKDRPKYILACKPSIKGGGSDGYMLFRLVRYESMYVPAPAATCAPQQPRTT
eukprot:Em0002g1553a